MIILDTICLSNTLCQGFYIYILSVTVTFQGKNYYMQGAKWESKGWDYLPKAPANNRDSI